MLENVLINGTPHQAFRKDTSVIGRTIYGYASAGTKDSDALWRIYAEDEVGYVFSRVFALKEGKATEDFVHVWDDRLSILPPPPTVTNSLQTTFNGTNNDLNGGDVHKYDAASAFSISLWITPQNLAAQRCLFAKATNDANVYGYILYHNANGKLFLQMRSAAANRQHTFGITLSPLVRQHVLFTYDGSSNINGVKVYVDGIQDTVPASGTLGSWLSGQDFTVGARNTAFRYSGEIDEISVWNKFLNTSEKDELFNNGSPTDLQTHSTFTNLKSWYRMGDGDSSPTILDNIGNDHLTMSASMSDSNFIPAAP